MRALKEYYHEATSRKESPSHISQRTKYIGEKAKGVQALSSSTCWPLAWNIDVKRNTTGKVEKGKTICFVI